MTTRKALAIAASLLALSFAGSAHAQGQQPYQLLQPPQPVDAQGKIEVTEFFWYGCPHCYTLEPLVAAWAKKAPGDVAFRRVPAVPNEAWAQAAVMYYTFEAMGVLEQMHQKAFDAWHKENKNLGNKRIREEWLKSAGIDVNKYNDVEKSFTVNSKVNRARQLTQAYKVDGVPRVFVGGKYYTAAEFAGGQERVFPVVDQLVAMARKESGAPAPAAAKK